MRILLIVILACLQVAVCGQSTYVKVQVPIKEMMPRTADHASYRGTAMEFPGDAEPFIAMNVEWRSVQPIPSDAVRISIRDDGLFAFWTRLSLDEHTGNNETQFFTNMLFLEPETRVLFIRVDVDVPWNDRFVDTVILHLFDPGPSSGKQDLAEHQIDNRNSDCSCPPPTLSSRAQWCPDGTCLPHPSPEPVFPSHLIIHHSAGSNASSDWAAVVRSIWNFHVNGNGWSDIGYNWLVDPNGVVYVGRGDNILGAHFCGKNSNTLGTCVMGDFTTVVPTEHALASLADLYAWKACTEDIDPLGSSFHPASANVIPNVSGHKQSCSTSCPGDAFFPTLQQVRERIAQVIHTCDCDLQSPLLLTAQTMSDQVRLNWDPVPGATGYHLERKGPSESDYTLLAIVGNTVYADINLEPGAKYQYQVRAVDGTCTSNATNAVSVDVPENWFLIRPTLVSDLVHVLIRNTTSDPVQMTVYSMEGRQVWANEFGKSTLDFSQSIPMRSFPAGVYILVVKQGDLRKTVRLTKV